MTSPMPEAETLMDKGYEALAGGDAQGVLKIGIQLEEMEYTGGFELQAYAHQLVGDIEKAAQALAKGTQVAPQNGILWQMLGQVMSELGEHDQAVIAYDEAMKKTVKDEMALAYNYACTLDQMGQTDQAISHIDKIVASDIYPDKLDPRLYLLTNALRYSLLRKEQKYDVLFSLYQDEEHDIVKLEQDFPVEVSRVYTEIAAAHMAQGRVSDAKHYLALGLGLNKHNVNLHWIYRELGKNKDYSKAHLYQILVKGKMPVEADDAERDFITTYDVIANDEAEALSIIKIFEPINIRDSIQIEEASILDPAPNQPKGVYRTTGYALYDEE